MPLNELGPTRITALANYPRGHYTLNVLADGKWKINLIEESRLAVIQKPFEYLSSGISVLGPFSASHVSLGAGYVGSLGQLFSVQVYGANGVLQSFPVFTIRSGLFKVTLHGVPNPYYLVVKGTGRWFIGVL